MLQLKVVRPGSTPADVKLEVGDVTQTVTVNAGAAEQLINREDATLGNTFLPKQITELPTNARSIPALLTLQPATTRSGYVAGSRADQANITLDGVDIDRWDALDARSFGSHGVPCSTQRLMTSICSADRASLFLGIR